MGHMRTITKDHALLPFVDRLLDGTKALGQDTGCLVAVRDHGNHGRRGAGLLAQGYQHGLAPGVDYKNSINSCKTARDMKRGIAFKVYAIVQYAKNRPPN